ncbi:MAG TPA: ferric reductase-like transmembrane domain-containing protein [Dongiaceae bacterium]|nr:ferric reductase-like transmembrane domain-containing protein [Dongiaceae bacterium]
MFAWRRLPWFDRAGQFSWLKTLCLAGLVTPGLWVAVAWYLADRNAPLPVDPGNVLPGVGNAAVGSAGIGNGGIGGVLPLGAMPVTEALHQIGLWTIRFLMITLAITPLRRIGAWPKLMLLRRMLGVGAFAYAAIHLSIYVVQQHFRLGFVASEILLRFYLTIGFVALIGLLALAATSTDRMMRRLGGKNWQRLHYLVYPIAALGLFHFFLQSKANVTEAALTTGFFYWLMLYRLAYRWNGEQALALWQLTLLAIAGGLATALGEAAWYQFATGLGGTRILLADLRFAFHIRPCWWVLAAGLALVPLKLAADRFWGAKKKRQRMRPAVSTI